MGRRGRPDRLKSEPVNGTSAVSKIDACRAEIDGAIDLYCRFQNHVGAHVLVCAASELLEVIKTKSEFGPSVLRAFIDTMPPETQGFLKEALAYHYNFLKHGMKDYEDVSHHDPRSTEWRLFLLAVEYAQVVGAPTPKQLAFCAWFVIHNFEQLPSSVRELLGAFDRSRLASATFENLLAEVPT